MEAAILRLTQKLGIGVALTALLYFLIPGLGGGLFLIWILTPGNVDWSGANKPSPADPTAIGFRGDPMQALQLPFETVSYETDLGPAAAWLVPAATRSSSGTMAVFVHGVGGIRENGYRQLAILHEAGIPVLMITYRNDAGAPVAERPLFSFGLTEWRDLDAAVDWCLDHGADRIVLVAESMGGAIAGQFLKNSPRAAKVEALVLDAPALDLTACVARLYGVIRLPFSNWLGVIAVWVAALVAGAPLTDAKVLDPVVDFPGPVFVAHGSADPLVPITLSRKLVAERRAPTTEFWTKAQHLQSYAEQPQLYRAALLGFLAKLRKAELVA